MRKMQPVPVDQPGRFALLGEVRGRLAVLLLAVAVPILAGTPAAGQETTAVESARKHMELGQAAFSRGEFEAAGAFFLEAYADKPFAAFLFNAGLAAERARDNGKAVELYRRYLAEEPTAKDALVIEAKIRALEPEPPPEVQVTEIAPEETAAPTPTPTATTDEMKSLVSVRVNPRDAQVRILGADGALAAELTGEDAKTVVRGSYRIEASHPAYKTVATPLEVVPGQVYVVVVEMSQGAFLGFVHVASDPPGAAVFVDDPESGAVGTTPWSNVLPPGRHRIRVEKPGFEPHEREIDVAVGEKKNVETVLARLPYGVLSVKANASETAVFVDGKKVGTAPFEGRASPGTHALRAIAEDMKEYSANFEIERGKETKALVRLAPKPSRRPAWVAFGFAVALFGAGGAFGGVALHLDRELESEKNAGRLADDDPRILKGFLWALGADVSFGIGAIVSGMCLYYFLRDPLPPSEGKVHAPAEMKGTPKTISARKLGERGDARPRFAVAPLVLHGGAGVGWGVAF